MPGKSEQSLPGFGQAYRKAADYCAVQDRCISEIQLKFKSWDFDKSLFRPVINKLIEEDFVNEKRFAINYSGGKFRINGWGRLKIAAGLRARSIPAEFIKEALSGIENEGYSDTLGALLQKKLKQLGGDTPENRQKAAFYAASRGFEPGLIASKLRDNDLFDL